ncbi:MAG: EF-P lysine aminoacylase EpmA [Gammaproteobacteria bacterium]|nr:EF-P lysine aminoacylase EpmA [Gammaproteobacteria bacterium]
MTWHPSAALDTLARRAGMLAETRRFFASGGVMEVETPTLRPRTVTEPHIQSIAVRIAALPAAPVFLQSSPEYCMKRLLAAGSGDIYQVCKVYRDGEVGHRHQPEFTMIEWYRHALGLDAMIAETAALLAALARAAGTAPPALEQYRYRELFRSATGLDPLQSELEALIDYAVRHPAMGATASLRDELGGDRSNWLDLIMSHAVLPEMPGGCLVAVTHYPACQAALARLDPGDPAVAERFEIFRNGLELANGYRELTDAAEQRARFERDRARRAAMGLPDVLPDEQLLAALEHGLPDCCGVAVGFDRVVMSFLNLDRIDAAVSFAP